MVITISESQRLSAEAQGHGSGQDNAGAGGQDGGGQDGGGQGGTGDVDTGGENGADGHPQLTDDEDNTDDLHGAMVIELQSQSK